MPNLGKITILIMKPSYFLISIVWKGLSMFLSMFPRVSGVAQSFEPLGPLPEVDELSVGCHWPAA